MKPSPEGLAPYGRATIFSETTVPAGLTKDHATKSGVWGVIHVTVGRLHYTIPPREEAHKLTPGVDGIIEPEVKHHVTPLGAVTFYVESWR